MKLNKKAVSPIIATVLLIAFSVAIGAIVMSWGKGQIEKYTEDIEKRQEQQTKCSLDASITIANIGGIDKICFRTIDSTHNKIEFIMENGAVELKDLQVSIIGKEDVFTNSSVLREEVAIAGILKEEVIYPTSIGDLEQIKMTPAVSVFGNKQFCTDAALKLTDIEECPP